MPAPPLANLPFLGSNTESHYNESTTNHAKANPPSGAPNGQNTESHSASVEKRRDQNTGIPNRTRGRTADRGGQRQSQAARRPTHDPACLPAWAASVRTMRPAMDPSRL